jgi:hypothetical protein
MIPSSLLPAGRSRSLPLLGVFVGAFSLLVVLGPYGRQHSWLALGLFAGMLGVFKLLSQFEKPV